MGGTVFNSGSIHQFPETFRAQFLPSVMGRKIFIYGGYNVKAVTVISSASNQIQCLFSAIVLVYKTGAFLNWPSGTTCQTTPGILPRRKLIKQVIAACCAVNKNFALSVQCRTCREVFRNGCNGVNNKLSSGIEGNPISRPGFPLSIPSSETVQGFAVTSAAAIAEGYRENCILPRCLPLSIYLFQSVNITVPRLYTSVPRPDPLKVGTSCNNRDSVDNPAEECCQSIMPEIHIAGIANFTVGSLSCSGKYR